MPNKYFMTAQEAAAFSGIPISELFDLVEQHKLKVIYYKDQLYFSYLAFDELYKKNSELYDSKNKRLFLTLFKERVRADLHITILNKWRSTMHYIRWKYPVNDERSQKFITDTVEKLMQANDDYINGLFAQKEEELCKYPLLCVSTVSSTIRNTWNPDEGEL